MRLKVFKDRIYVVLEEMVTTVRGIAIADNHSERSRIGIVKQVGEEIKHPGKWWQFWLRPKFKPGDRVLLSVYAGVRIHLIGHEIDGLPIDEDRHRIIRAEEILCQIFD